MRPRRLRLNNFPKTTPPSSSRTNLHNSSSQSTRGGPRGGLRVDEEQNYVICTHNQSSQGGGRVSRPRTGNSPSPRKLPVACVSRECHHSHSQRPVLCSMGAGRGALFACERLPLELCEAGPWRHSSYISHDAFLEVLRGRTVTSALGVFPSPAEVQSPHLFRGL